MEERIGCEHECLSITSQEMLNEYLHWHGRSPRRIKRQNKARKSDLEVTQPDLKLLSCR